MLKEVFAIPAVGALIYRIKDNKLNILVQERYKENEIFEKGLLELPAGKIREYEDIFKALKREVEEETGLTVREIIGENNIDTREMGEYTVNSYVPFCCTQNLSGGYSIILQTFLCKVEGKIIPNSNETRNVRWMNVDDIYSSINKKLEAWYPMHINTLFKFIDYYQKGFIYE